MSRRALSATFPEMLATSSPVNVLNLVSFLTSLHTWTELLYCEVCRDVLSQNQLINLDRGIKFDYKKVTRSFKILRF